MTNQRVLVVGSTGMLGGTVYQTLARSDLEVLEASRSRGLTFDAEVELAGELLRRAGLKPGDFVVNCVGLTKTHINEDKTETLERAIRLNVLFPIALARAAEKLNLRVIQVATDCVFSGGEGKYVESSPHDAYDAYGKSKSLGEVKSEHVMHLRCSLVGPEGKGRKSLLFEWVRALQPESQVNGYVNHRWNGLTSLTFAKIVAGILDGDKFIPGTHHLVPADELTKYELIKLELELLAREDVQVEAFQAPQSIDRTLATVAPETNSMLFAGAGYKRVPTIREMMNELPWGALKER
jgi:dTDP-4-dehydrorhamnose reductase